MASHASNTPFQYPSTPAVPTLPAQPLSGGRPDPDTAALVRALQATWARGLAVISQ